MWEYRCVLLSLGLDPKVWFYFWSNKDASLCDYYKMNMHVKGRRLRTCWQSQIKNKISSISSFCNSLFSYAFSLKKCLLKPALKTSKNETITAFPAYLLWFIEISIKNSLHFLQTEERKELHQFKQCHCLIVTAKNGSCNSQAKLY